MSPGNQVKMVHYTIQKPIGLFFFCCQYHHQRHLPLRPLFRFLFHMQTRRALSVRHGRTMPQQQMSHKWKHCQLIIHNDEGNEVHFQTSGLFSRKGSWLVWEFKIKIGAYCWSLVEIWEIPLPFSVTCLTVKFEVFLYFHDTVVVALVRWWGW